MVNSLGLNDAELDALRGLQKGSNQLVFADPIWAELQASASSRFARPG